MGSFPQKGEEACDTKWSAKTPRPFEGRGRGGVPTKWELMQPPKKNSPLQMSARGCCFYNAS